MSSPTPTTPSLRTSGYDQMLDEFDRDITKLTEKIKNGRIRDAERDKARVKQYRPLAHLIRTKRQVLEDVTLQELEAEIEELKPERGGL